MCGPLKMRQASNVSISAFILPFIECEIFLQGKTVGFTFGSRITLTVPISPRSLHSALCSTIFAINLSSLTVMRPSPGKFSFSGGNREMCKSLFWSFWVDEFDCGFPSGVIFVLSHIVKVCRIFLFSWWHFS